MNHNIKSKNIVSNYDYTISNFSNDWRGSFSELSNFFNKKFQISSTIDIDIIKFTW